MNKTFTLAEAQMLLPVLQALLERAQASALRRLQLESEMQGLSQRIFLSGGLRVDVASAAGRRVERNKALQELKDTLGELEAIGVKVQDLEAGILDLPFLLEGDTVMLCWKVGEREIAFWHPADQSANSRRPLDSRFGRTERLN